MDHWQGESFGDLLQRLRKRARLTQAALAERIGAHRTTVSFWERGEYLPETLTMVLELARVLQLNETDQRLLIEARFGTASILPFHNLPDPNPYFTGRTRLLETLHAALTAGEQVALVQAQAISGLGGIGKTQLALAYAYRYRQHYHDMLWALAESHETLTTSYMTLAQHLHLDLRSEHEQQKVVEAVKRWLREHKGWLLILDNLEDLSLVRAFVPTPHQGAVLLTTRRAETSPLAYALALDVLPEEEGILFLLRRAGQLPMEATLAAAAPAQRAAAQAIVEALGALPLALDQAGAYLAETRCRLPDYLALLQQEQAVLLGRRGTIPGDHPQSVITTFALTFERVRQRNEAASNLLKLCAYLAPEAIPLDLFRLKGVELGPELTPVTAQALALDAVLETLQAYSLVRRETEQDTLSLHRLVQVVQQEALTAAEQQCWAERAVRLVSASFPVPEAATWARCQQLLPHALLCARHIGRWGFAFPEAGILLHQAGRYLFQRAAYEQGQPLLQQALVLREQVLGPNHPDVAQTLDILARLSHEQGQYHQALPLYQHALAIREQTLGPAHLDVAQSLNSLAEYYRFQGQYAEAQPLSERALAIAEQLHGPNHPDVAQSLNNLAEISWEQGQYEQALPLFQRALAIREQVLGPVHPDVAISLNTLANLYFAQGQYNQALPLYQRALTIREQILGAAHPDLAVSLNNLATLYRAQGQFAEALPLYKRAVAMWERVVGPDHPQVATCLNNLANLYRTLGEYDQALPLFQRALAIREQALVPAHTDVAVSLNNLANLYRAMGKFAEALPLAERGLAIREQALGPDHPHVATSLNTLAQLRRLQGYYEQALPPAERALAIREQFLGPDHPEIAASLNTLAQLYRDQGRYVEALPLAERALALREQVLEPRHPDLAESLNTLARLYEDQGRDAEALPLVQQAFTILQHALPDHPDTTATHERLAALLRRIGRAEAVGPLRSANHDGPSGNVVGHKLG